MAREWGSIRGAMFLCILVFVSCAVMSEAQELGLAESETSTQVGSDTDCTVASRPLGESNGLYVPYTTLFPNGYCRHILGTNMIYGEPNQLYQNEESLQQFQYAKSFLNMSSRQSEINNTDLMVVQSIIGPQKIVIRRTCLKLADDIYCHWYFPQFRISPAVQPICREFCEKVRFHVCKEEFQLAVEFNRFVRGSLYPYNWNIIDCTTFPWRNTSRTGSVDPECYYHDNVRDQLDNLPDQECFYGIGKGYTGSVNVTRSGYTCQSWNKQCPHQHDITQMYPEMTNSSNLCRNPGGLGTEGPWCFTTNPNVTWEYCGVPKCEERGPSSPPPRVESRNISSTGLLVTWDPVPFRDRRGVLQGYDVACAKQTNGSTRSRKRVPVTVRHVTFTGLEKYTDYSCRVRAVNNFGNGTWSELVTVSTAEDVPSASPQRVRAWTVNSTGVNMTWEPVPRLNRHGRIINYTIRFRYSGDKKGRSQSTTDESLLITNLRKFTEYSLDVCAWTCKGAGPTSHSVIVKTDEDVPSKSPRNVQFFPERNHGAIVLWEKVPSGYENGVIKGYKILVGKYRNGSQSTTHVVNSTQKRRAKLEGLEPRTQYSVRVLAFTAVGDGPASDAALATTPDDEPAKVPPSPVPVKSEVPQTALIAGVTVAALLAVALLILAFVIYFRRQRQLENRFQRLVAPYAVTSIEEIERRYETIPEGYMNLRADGTLALPPHLLNSFITFEQVYENMRYKRLMGTRPRSRSIGGAVDEHGRPTYDVLSRLVVTTTEGSAGEGVAEVRETQGDCPVARKRSRSVDLGLVQAFVKAINECTSDQADEEEGLALEQLSAF